MLAQNDRKLYIKIMVGNILFNFFINKGIFESDHEWSIGKHNNTAFEMHYCMKGKGIIVIDDVPYELNEGDFCLIRPGIYHAQQKVGDFELQKCCLSFDFKAINYDLPSDLNPLVLDEGQRVIKTLNEVDYFVAHEPGRAGLFDRYDAHGNSRQAARLLYQSAMSFVPAAYDLGPLRPGTGECCGEE